MRRFLVIILTLLVGATVWGSSASAGRPLHAKQTSQRVFDLPAGSFCDFAYHEESNFLQNIKIFFDDSGNPIGTEDQIRVSVIHTNVETGVTLTEVLHYAVHVDFVTGEYRVTGSSWQLRDENGRIVLVGAGMFLVDLFTFELIVETPNVRSDFAATICPALGGASAL